MTEARVIELITVANLPRVVELIMVARPLADKHPVDCITGTQTPNAAEPLWTCVSALARED
jgi:hypothetical protein